MFKQDKKSVSSSLFLGTFIDTANKYTKIQQKIRIRYGDDVYHNVDGDDPLI